MIGDGVLLYPDDDRWDDARAIYNLLVDQRPAAIGLPRGGDDVAALVEFAAGEGLRVLTQRTGHEAAAYGALDDTLLIRTTAMKGVSFDPASLRAEVAPGALWGELVAATSESGLTALHGSGPNIGIVGYTLAGGLGWYARKHGLACNRVISFELVTADGARRKVDAASDPELFWALRGGGGDFGVVTALEFELLRMPEVFAGCATFPIERAAEVFEAWLAWTAAAPEDITSNAHLVRFPPAPELPVHLRGQAFALIEAVSVGGESEAREALAPLLALKPAMDSFAMTSPIEVLDLHLDPPQPIPFIGDGMLLGELTPAAIEAALEVVGPASDSKLITFEFRHLGGALDRAADDHGALARLSGSYLYYGAGLVAGPDDHASTAGKLADLRSALEPWGDGHYLCFTDRPVDLGGAYPEETLARLREVKRRYDPGDLFRASHPVVADPPSRTRRPPG